MLSLRACEVAVVHHCETSKKLKQSTTGTARFWNGENADYKNKVQNEVKHNEASKKFALVN